MTLMELYELVDELLEEHGEDMEVKFHNPITNALEDFNISEVEEFNPDTKAEVPCIVIHTDEFEIDDDDLVPGDNDDETS